MNAPEWDKTPGRSMAAVAVVAYNSTSSSELLIIRARDSIADDNSSRR